MKASAIFLDIDKTLTPHGDWMKVSKQDLEIIKKAQKANIPVVLSTGRCEYFSHPIWKKVKHSEFGKYIIVSNGGAIKNPFTNELLMEKKIPLAKAKKIVEFTKKNNLLFFTPDNPYFYVEKENKAKYKWCFDVYGKWMGVRSISEFDFKKHSYRKIEIQISENVKETEKWLKIYRKEFPGLEIIRTSDSLIEITQKGISKGYAVKYIAKQEGWNLKDAIAIGDSPNDVEMLKVVGHPVAMGNAFKEVIKVSKYQTDSVDNSGVSKALKKLLNIK